MDLWGQTIIIINISRFNELFTFIYILVFQILLTILTQPEHKTFNYHLKIAKSNLI
jgi:hypothetical protein